MHNNIYGTIQPKNTHTTFANHSENKGVNFVHIDQTNSTCNAPTRRANVQKIFQNYFYNNQQTVFNHSNSAAQNTLPSSTSKAQQVFNDVWSTLEKQHGSNSMKFPKKIVWLMGAPGSGKSVLSELILSESADNSTSSSQVTMSSLLTGNAEFERLKSKAELIDDRAVIGILFDHLISQHNDHIDNVLVDGFPRNEVQVQCVKLLNEKLSSASNHISSSSSSNIQNEQHLKIINNNRPNHINNSGSTSSNRAFHSSSVQHSTDFEVFVLHVDEKKSISRQLSRGREAKEHNQRIKGSSVALKEERATDNNEELARKRYNMFKEEAKHLDMLKQHFPFRVIDANADIHQVKASIRNKKFVQNIIESTATRTSEKDSAIDLKPQALPSSSLKNLIQPNLISNLFNQMLLPLH